MRKIRLGIALTYAGLIINTISGFFLTPFMLKHWGDLEFSIYQLIVSISGYLMVVNMGTGVAMNRFVSMFRAKKDKEIEGNYIFMNILITIFLMIIVMILGFFIFIHIGDWFPKLIYTKKYIVMAKTLCMITTVNVTINFLAGALEGILLAYERIDIVKFYAVFKLIIRVISIYLLIRSGSSPISITIVDTITILGYLILLIFVIRRECGLSFKISKFTIDKKLFSETLIFSSASLLSGLSGQLNNNIDKTILARLCSEYEISVYTVATNFYIMFTSVGVSLNNIFLNKITSLTYSESNMQKVEELNIKVGRFQNFVIGLLFWGFVCLGKDFIFVWMQGNYPEIYLYSLLLIIPNYLVCIGGVQNAILDAQNKQIVKSVIVFFIGILNVILTIMLIKAIGGIGAPVGTNLSLIIGYNICLNIYMHKKLNINILNMYKNILKGFWKAQLISVILFLIITNYNVIHLPNLWCDFILKGSCFIIIYTILCWILALDNIEKKSILSYFYRHA